MAKSAGTRRKGDKPTKIAAFGPKVTRVATSGRIVKDPAKPSKLNPAAIYQVVVKVSAA